MGKTTIILIIITIISKLIGFLRDAVMANYYGAGNIVAIYTVATTIPVLISSLISNGVTYGFIPIYNKIKKEKSNQHAEKFTSNLFNALFIIGIIIIGICFIFTETICKIFSPSIEGALLEEAVLFTRIILFSILAYFYAAVYRGYLNLKGNFIVPSTVGIIMNTILIIFIIISSKLEKPVLLAWGTLLANFFQYSLYPIALRKLGYKHQYILNKKDENLKRLLLIAVPIVVSSAASDIALLLDNSIASYFFGNQSISIIKYSKQLSTLALTMITMSVTTSLFPTIARLGQNREFDKMKFYISRAISLTLLIVIPAISGLMSLSNPIVKLVYGRGKFGASDVITTSSLLYAYLPFVIFQSISDIIDKGFYSVGNSRTPVFVVLIQQTVNIVLNIFLARIFGIEGIAYATVISCFVGMILMANRFRNYFGTLKNKDMIKSIIKISISSLIMAMFANFTYNVLIGKFSNVLALFFTITLSVFVYLILLILLKVDEITYIFNMIRDKIKKK